MIKLYGSLNNRLEEGKMFCEKIEVGTGVTEYGYSNKYPYEVVEVKDQKHIVIREMETKRIDKNGMSDCQEYQYISNTNNPKIELVNKNGVWFKVLEHSKEKWLQGAENIKDSFKNKEIAYNYIKCMAGLTSKQYENIEAGKIVNKYIKMNISFGVMEKYYDYTF